MEAQSSSRFLEKQSNNGSNPMQSTAKYPGLTGGSIFTQSATSLTRGVILWSFPKAKRFKEAQISTKDAPMIDLGSTLSKTSTSLGFGKRYSFRPVDTPGPSLSHRSLPSVKSQTVLLNNQGSCNRES